MSTLGNRLKLVRNKLGLTQSQFANKLHILYNSISRYEQNKIIPTATILKNISYMYNVNINWLLTGEGNMFLKECEKKGDSEYIIKEKREKCDINNDKLSNIIEYLSKHPSEIDYVYKIIKAKEELRKKLNDFIEDKPQ